MARPEHNGLARLEAGLDSLADARATPRRRIRRQLLPPLVAVAVVLAAWQGLYLAGGQPDWVLSGPGEVWQSLADAAGRGEVWSSLWNSVSRGGLGFLVSVAVGTPLGVLVGRVRPVRTAVGPILSGLQNLPSVAWVPPAVIFFGVTPGTVYTVILLGAVPSVANGLVSGLDQVPPLFLKVGRNLGATGLSSVRHVLLPAALPGYVAGLKQGWAFAWRSLMAAEIIATSASLGHGLGQLLKQAQDTNDMALAFGAIALVLVVGIGVNQLVFAPVERRVLRSHGLVSTMDSP
jgi:NitT/TauT family transport system permease protein